MKIYINDFVEDLNYRKIILYIGNIDSDRLHEKLKKDNLGHLYRFDYCKENKLMFVENCDLQDVNTSELYDYGDSLLYLTEEGYSILPLYFDAGVGRYYVNIDDWS